MLSSAQQRQITPGRLALSPGFPTASSITTGKSCNILHLAIVSEDLTARLTYHSIRLATSELGGPSAGVYFVDHGDYAAQVMENLGETVVDEDYPNDHTHTAPELVSDTLCLVFIPPSEALMLTIIG